MENSVFRVLDNGSGLWAVCNRWETYQFLYLVLECDSLLTFGLFFTFHSCNDRRGLPLVNAVRCSCESGPGVRSCPLNTLSPAKNHSSQPGHDKQYWNTATATWPGTVTTAGENTHYISTSARNTHKYGCAVLIRFLNGLSAVHSLIKPRFHSENDRNAQLWSA